MAEDGLTFADLQAHVALALGVAYYGAAGDEAAQTPIDVATLARINSYVHGGIRMFLADAPAQGWEFQHPVAEISLWATRSSTANGAPVYDAGPPPLSTVTVHTTLFRGSMVGHNLAFTVTSTADGVPTYTAASDTTVVDVDDAIFKAGMIGQEITFTATGNSYTIIGYTDTTTVTIEGDASGEADADTVTAVHNYPIVSVTSVLVAVVTGDASGEADGGAMTVTADGNYMLPTTFGGESTGRLTYAAGTNKGTFPAWDNEGDIRRLRANTDSWTGTPYRAAIRKSSTATRWELVVYPTPEEDYTVLLPYELHFSVLVAATDVHPAGAHYDEAVKAACEAYAEMHGEDILAGQHQYYLQRALPAAYRRNRRSIPKRLGSLRTTQHRITDWRDTVPRPDVTIS